MSAHAHAHADEMQESGRTEDAALFFPIVSGISYTWVWINTY
jgi:hypothetical protein